MHLKSLAIRGFKSFADKTQLAFEPGITVIVGPNGSGKSNITDAVLWALGEQSSRSLRGSSMEDVIFAGSSARSSLGVAEVFLCLDNSNEQIPIEFSEVTISRRVFRSGESEYRINGSPCRLLDIQELLSDTGIGREMHSIIGQGKLEEVLNSKPQERRALIDDAAGVLKYRKRKDKALKKITGVEQNLVRIKDIQREVDNQLQPLRKQAQQAQTYNKLATELRDVEINLAVMDLRALHSDWENLGEREQSLTSRINKAKNNLEEQAQKTKNYEIELDKKNPFSNDLQSQERQLENILERLAGSSLLIKEKHKNFLEHLESIRTEREKIEAKKSDKTAGISRVREEEKKASEELEALNKEMADGAEKINALKQNLKQTDKELHELKTSILSQQNQISDNEKERTSLQHVLSDTASKLNLIEGMEQSNLAKKQEMQNYLSEKEKQKQDLEAELLQLTTGLESCQYGCSQTADLKRLRGLLLNEIEVEIDSWRSKISQGSKKRQLILAKKEQIAGRRVAAEAKIAYLEREETDLKHQIERMSEKIKQNEEAKTNLFKDKNRTEELSGELQVKEASLTARKGYLQQQLREMEETAKEFDRDFEQEDVIADSYKKRLQMAKSLQQLNSLLKKKVELKIVELKNSVNDGRVAFGDMRKLIGDSKAQEQNLNSQIWELQEKLHKLELSKAQLELKVTAAVQKVVEEYNLPLERALETSPQGLGQDETYRKIKELRSRIIALGPINPIAIEEHKALEERHSLLVSQSDDLRKSRRALYKVIEQIDKEIEKAFLNTFRQVNKHFQSVFASLFNEGRVELILTDPDDLLYSGVEVEVYPDGKKLQKVSLLSGGERALTALALLFGIFHTKPSPFYILDEVEATLDDLNLQRFVSLLNEMKKSTQFIVVTHQKRTMEVADCLYGVSMQADGVSKLLSQKIN